MSEHTAETFDSVAALDSACDELQELRDELERIGESEVEAAVDAYRDAHRILDRYADEATGTGDFRSYVEFRGQYSTFVENLPEWLPRRKVFEKSLEAVDKRRLNEGDFARARETLDGVDDLVAMIEGRDDARNRYRDARLDAANRLDAIDEEIADLDHVLELGEADLDAPVERLRDPIEQYNESVRKAFREYRHEASAREFLSFVDRTQYFPLVALPRPPDELLAFVRESPDGTETVPTLLEYAEYSRSKLVHYADDADALKRKIATQQTYLDRLDADPLTLSWPPAEATLLRWRADELRRAISRFAPESVIANLREVRRLTTDEAAFKRLRRAAIALDELDEETRQRLEAGAIATDLERLRAEKRALRERLDELPEP
jgi:hypothetical protein